MVKNPSEVECVVLYKCAIWIHKRIWSQYRIIILHQIRYRHFKWVDMQQKLPAYGFKCKKDTLNLYYEKLKTMMKTVTKDSSLKVTLIIPRNYLKHTVTYCSYQKDWTLIKVKSYDKKKYIIHKVLKRELGLGIIL